MMTYEEAREIMKRFDPSKRLVDDDGKFWDASRIVGRVEESKKLINAEIKPEEAVFLTQKEAAKLSKAVAANRQAKLGMSPEEADRIIKRNTTPSGKVVPDGEEAERAHRVLYRQAEADYCVAHPGEVATSLMLSKAEIAALNRIGKGTNKLIEATDKERARRKRQQEKGPSLWQRVTRAFRRNEKKEMPRKKSFYWDDPSLWHAVKFQSGDQVLFSYRINVSRLTPEQEQEVKRNLDQRHIKYTERRASANAEGVLAGDKTIRLADEKSIENFRLMVLNQAMQPGWRPSAMSRADYDELQKRLNPPAPVKTEKTSATPSLDRAQRESRGDSR